ncbi:MAG: VUT family protein, partial [Bacteroidetes bacterium]
SCPECWWSTISMPVIQRNGHCFSIVPDSSKIAKLRGLTRGKHLWLRATGSTFGSQFLDTFIVLVVAFAGQLAFADIVAITLFNYSYKFLIAVLITPLIYLAHWVMDRYLGRELAEELIHQAEQGDTPA